MSDAKVSVPEAGSAYPIVLGPTIHHESDSDFMLVQYNFQPSTVSRAVMGTVALEHSVPANRNETSHAKACAHHKGMPALSVSSCQHAVPTSRATNDALCRQACSSRAHARTKLSTMATECIKSYKIQTLSFFLMGIACALSDCQRPSPTCSTLLTVAAIHRDCIPLVS
jgi:hypothetical protein